MLFSEGCNKLEHLVNSITVCCGALLLSLVWVDGHGERRLTLGLEMILLGVSRAILLALETVLR